VAVVEHPVAVTPVASTTIHGGTDTGSDVRDAVLAGLILPNFANDLRESDRPGRDCNPVGRRAM